MSSSGLLYGPISVKHTRPLWLGLNFSDLHGWFMKFLRLLEILRHKCRSGCRRGESFSLLHCDFRPVTLPLFFTFLPCRDQNLSELSINPLLNRRKACRVLDWIHCWLMMTQWGQIGGWGGFLLTNSLTPSNKPALFERKRSFLSASPTSAWCDYFGSDKMWLVSKMNEKDIEQKVFGFKMYTHAAGAEVVSISCQMVMLLIDWCCWKRQLAE